MTHGRGESDSAIVAGSRRTSGAIRCGAGGAKAEAEGMRASKAWAGHRAGEPCHRRWRAYGKQQGKGRRRSSPRSSTTSA